MIPDKSAIGSSLASDGATVFRVWAPAARNVMVHLIDNDRPTIAMDPEPFGYYRARVEGVINGTRYRYILDGKISGLSGPSWTAASNVWEEEKGFNIQLALPGWDTKDLSIQVEKQI